MSFTGALPNRGTLNCVYRCSEDEPGEGVYVAGPLLWATAVGDKAELRQPKKGAYLLIQLTGVPPTSNRLGRAVNERMFLGRGFG